jgi:hypothetical protein
MSFNFSTVSANGPTPTTPAAKDVQVKAVKLTFADFTTGGTAAVKAVLPMDASIIGVRFWTKTTFSGNAVSALSLAIGVAGTATKYVNAALSLTGGTYSIPSSAVTNIFQDAGVETTDQSLLFTGTATTGNPTAGEAYVLIEYVR